jgi:decaprenylphospho-beta-D-erythro-pentofuranosid-2-ulose 2-reductase
VTVRTALVLGGTSDIAQAVLRELGSAGLERAVLAVRDPQDVAGLVVPGVEVHAVSWDALDVQAHRGLVAAAADRLGTVDLVLCAVGLLGHHAGLGMEPGDVDRMVRTNFSGPAAALAAAADQLATQAHGTLVVLSSVAGVRPRRSNFVYGSTKSGLDAYARGLADALADTAVRVLVVRPGFVRSRMTEGLDPAPFASTPEAVATAIARRLRSGRGGVLWVPPLLGPLFAVLANVPGALWRRIAGDR